MLALVVFIATGRATGWIITQIFHLITGAALGIPIYGVIKASGKRFHLVKGAFMGLVTWGVLNNFGQRMGLFSTKAHLTKTHYAALWNNLIYGITTAELITRIGHKTLFNEQTQNLSALNEETKMSDNEFAADIDEPADRTSIAYH